tara:strand:- start:414 stop:725 length:312 start_codon:yes stop_codon:yes gene_type:complete
MSKIGINITAQAFPNWASDEFIEEVMRVLVTNPAHYGIPCNNVWAWRADELEDHEINIEGELSKFPGATTSAVFEAIEEAIEQQKARRNYCQFDKSKMWEYAG